MKQIKKIVIGYLIVFVLTAGVLLSGLFSNGSTSRNSQTETLTLDHINQSNIYTSKLDK